MCVHDKLSGRSYYNASTNSFTPRDCGVEEEEGERVMHVRHHKLHIIQHAALKKKGYR